MRKRKRIKPLKNAPFYRQVWRIVDGAVADAMKCHPEYFTGSGTRNARSSIVKRVVGAINGYVDQWSAEGRSTNPPGNEG
jgi:hypothetical protein